MIIVEKSIPILFHKIISMTMDVRTVTKIVPVIMNSINLNLSNLFIGILQ